MKNIYFFIHSLAFILLISPLQMGYASTDPARQLLEEIQVLKSMISEETSSVPCYGNNLGTYYKETITVQDKQLDLLEKQEASKTYLSQVKTIDTQIQKVVTEYDKKNSCKAMAIVKPQLNTILNLRKDLYTKMYTDPKFALTANPSTDTKDSKSYIFSQTRELWQKFISRSKEVKSTLASLKKGNESEYWKENSWALEQSEREEIRQRAQDRANDYVQDFANSINSAIYSPMLAERSSILSNIGALPSGQSTQIRHEWDMEKQLAEKPKENIKKTLEENTQRIEAIPRTQIADEIFLKKKQEQDTALYYEKLKTLIADQQAYVQFDDALGQSIVNSLQPFHQSLNQTTQTLLSQKKALNTVLQKQNKGAGQ